MTTYYINASTGNDTTGNGSSGNPWLTPSKAATAATSGDTISCAAGTYTWASIAQGTKSLNWVGASLSGGLPTTIFAGASTATSVQYSLNSGVVVTYTNISFRTFRNSGSTSCCWQNVYDGLGGVATLSFTKCAFSNILLSSAAGGGGLIGENSGSQTMSLTFISCLFYAIGKVSGATAGYLINHVATCTITWTGSVFHNSITGDKLDAILGRGSTATIKNGIFQSVGATIAINGNSAPTPTATYSCGNGITLPSGVGNISSDPLFVDAANGNFNLRPTSPCINTGTLI